MELKWIVKFSHFSFTLERENIDSDKLLLAQEHTFNKLINLDCSPYFLLLQSLFVLFHLNILEILSYPLYVQIFRNPEILSIINMKEFPPNV